MADTLYVPVSSKILSRILEQAGEHGTTPEEEVVTILRDRFYDDDEGSLGFGSKVIALFSGSGVGFETPIEEIRGGTTDEQIYQAGAAEGMNEEKGLGTQIAELFGNHGLREDEFPNR
jgi:hypothetical protein